MLTIAATTVIIFGKHPGVGLRVTLYLLADRDPFDLPIKNSCED